jgi:hypothetical protein
MRNGQVFELPMLGHLTTDSEFSSLPIPEDSMLRTPSVTDSSGGARSEKQATERGQMVKTADQVVQLAFENGLKVSPAVTASLLPTPAVGHIRNHDEPVENYLQRRQDFIDGRTKGMPGASLGVAVRMETQPELLPTPNTMEHREIKTPEQIAELKAKSPGGYRNLREIVINEMPEPDLLPTPQALEGFNGNNLTVAHREGQGRQVMLSNHAVDLAMLPTPLVDDAKNSGQNQTRRGTLASEVYGGNDSTNWGKFEPAIRRWEQIFGHPAPAPTKPDGKDGAHRLSAEFTEWMMGLVPGWITGADISRAEALKAAGNGVVPQQAELALRQLLQGIDLIPKNVAPSD